eukprot:SAG31_NODE_458_length_15415_cov_3.647428_3_plen_78_part_00
MHSALLVEQDDDDQLVTFDEFETEWHEHIRVANTITGRAYAKNRVQAVTRQIVGERQADAKSNLMLNFTVSSNLQPQ